MRYFLITVLALTALSGCASSKPKISHVHIGHAITGWVDTPEKRGLFVTAEMEADVIADETSAASAATDLGQVQTHMRNAMHAIDPTRQPNGTGTGYGFLRGLTDAKKHIEFAGQSDDATQNLRAGAADFARNYSIVVERAGLIWTLAESAVRSESLEEARLLSGEARTLAIQNLEGVDEDGDGVIGSRPTEYGLRQLRSELVAMTEREDPPYRAVRQRYLFGLVRLPDGTWAFKDPDSSGRYGRY